MDEQMETQMSNPALDAIEPDDALGDAAKGEVDSDFTTSENDI